MSTATLEKRYTPEDLLAMRDGKQYELVGGRLVERNMGAESSWIGGNVFFRLRDFDPEQQVGWLLPADASYQCFRDDPSKVRKPDTSFIRRGRLPGERIPKGHIPIAPDLAVEVISPNDLAHEVETKVEEYREAGVSLVWVVCPETWTVTVYRADGSVTRLHVDDELTGEDVIPGFTCRVRDILPPAQDDETAAAQESQ